MAVEVRRRGIAAAGAPANAKAIPRCLLTLHNIYYAHLGRPSTRPSSYRAPGPGATGQTSAFARVSISWSRIS